MDDKTNPRKEKLANALKELGKGKNQIAACLKTKRIRGVAGDSQECPISIFVKKLFPKAESVEVYQDFITVKFKNDQHSFELPTPKLIGQFIENFDAEEFPDLVKS